MLRLGLLSLILFVLLSSVSYASEQKPCFIQRQSSMIIMEEVHRRLVDTARADLIELYRRCDYSTIWIVEGKLTPQGRALAELIQFAPDYGLNASDYFLPVVPSQSLGDLLAARTDILLSNSVLLFVHDLRCGRLTPQQAGADIVDSCTDFDLDDWVWRLASAANVRQDLDALEPNAPGYRRTKLALQRWEKLRPNGPLPPMGQQADLDSSLRRQAVTAQLRLEGDLGLSTDNQVTDIELTNALKSFQERHGLVSTGDLNRETYEQLSVPIKDRVMQLQLTLERWRWIVRSFSRSPVVVNIPEFKLRAYDDSLNVIFTMKVIVGGAYHRHTPVFSNEISAIDFRPYWNVPSSIQRNELGPAIRKDPNYLSRHNYEIVRGSNGATRIRQRPGEQNALGLIRFSLPNTHNVYLHDTPRRELFEKIRRDFSHGCIRVEQPAKLATWLLEGNVGWTEQSVLESMHGDRSFSVRLTAPRPVLIVYGTGFAAEDGKVYFLADLYKEDSALKVRLDRLSRDREIESARLQSALNRTR